MPDYPATETAVLLVDPLNEFLSEGGKLYPLTAATASATGTVANLKRLVDGARAAGLTVAYALHHANTGGDYDGWKFLNPSHQGTRDFGHVRGRELRRGGPPRRRPATGGHSGHKSTGLRAGSPVRTSTTG